VDGWSGGDRAGANDQAAGDFAAAGAADEEDEPDSFVVPEAEPDSFFAPEPAPEAPFELSAFGSDPLEPLTVARLSVR
jgi:hypothetical protein